MAGGIWGKQRQQATAESCCTKFLAETHIECWALPVRTLLPVTWWHLNVFWGGQPALKPWAERGSKGLKGQALRLRVLEWTMTHTQRKHMNTVQRWYGLSTAQTTRQQSAYQQQRTPSSPTTTLTTSWERGRKRKWKRESKGEGKSKWGIVRVVIRLHFVFQCWFCWFCRKKMKENFLCQLT